MIVLKKVYSIHIHLVHGIYVLLLLYYYDYISHIIPHSFIFHLEFIMNRKREELQSVGSLVDMGFKQAEDVMQHSLVKKTVVRRKTRNNFMRRTRTVRGLMRKQSSEKSDSIMDSSVGEFYRIGNS